MAEKLTTWPDDERAARAAWWRTIALQGDPIRRPNLIGEAFRAGWEAGRAALQHQEKNK